MTELKIGGLIPVRMTSERLPGKALLDLAGQPVLYHLLDRIAACRFIESPRDIVVCTTEDASDDALCEAVESYGASTYRGERDDIIARFSGAMTAFGFDAVIQADGDDPLSATEYMDLTMARLLDPDLPNADIVTVSGLPLGCATKSFSAKGLEKVMARYRSELNDTGFIYFFTKTGICDHVELTCEKPEHQHDTARLTLDYPDDLAVFRQIFETLFQQDNVFSLSDTVEYLNAHPDVASQNLHLNDDYWARTDEKSFLMYTDEMGTERRIVV